MSNITMYDEFTNNIFTSTEEKINKAFKEVNEKLSNERVTLGDFYDVLGAYINESNREDAYWEVSGCWHCFGEKNQPLKMQCEEMVKLETYLKEHNIPYEINYQRRIDITKPQIDFTYQDYAQICVPKPGEGCRWDAICAPGSYGFEKGLLEIYGDILTEEDGEYDSVVGFLTAEEVIKRIELKEKANA